jgi:tetratricopeptide (TPR) repeat protein
MLVTMPMRPFSARCAGLATTLLALACLPALGVRAQEGSLEAMELSISRADKSLRDGNSAGAEAAYHQGILEGWLLLGTLERLEGHPEQARDAFLKASKEAGGERRGAFAAAQLFIQQDELPEARKNLERLLKEDPGDLEAAFALGRVELGEKKPAAAEALFGRLQRERPIPQTHLIVGRTWRDFGDFTRARASFNAALALDAAAPHAHYELGLTALRGEGRAGLEAAIPEFQAELARDPADTRAALELGVALVEV